MVFRNLQVTWWALGIQLYPKKLYGVYIFEKH
jgi:hypothetical protein